jgi:hypothetical protein
MLTQTHFYVPPSKLHRVGDVYAVNEDGKLDALQNEVMTIGGLTFSTVPPASQVRPLFRLTD